MKVVIIGTGSMATQVIDSLQLERNFTIAGLIDDEKENYTFKGYNVIGKKTDLPAIKKQGGIDHAIIAVGDCDVREKISYVLDECGYRLITCIHPSAVVASDVKINIGSIIGPGVVLGTNVVLEKNVIIDTGSIIGAGTKTGDNVSIQVGVTIGGGVTIGKNVMVRTGATISGLLYVGRHNIVEVGDVIKNDLPDKPIA